MASLIVDEGEGAREHPLRDDRTVVGSNPACDIRLRHLTATGSRLVLDRSARPARLSVLKGEVLLNERSVVTSELRHDDLLRVGETTLRYRDPPSKAAPPATPALAAASRTLDDLRRLHDAVSPPHPSR